MKKKVSYLKRKLIRNFTLDDNDVIKIFFILFLFYFLLKSIRLTFVEITFQVSERGEFISEEEIEGNLYIYIVMMNNDESSREDDLLNEIDELRQTNTQKPLTFPQRFNLVGTNQQEEQSLTHHSSHHHSHPNHNCNTLSSSKVVSNTNINNSSSSSSKNSFFGFETSTRLDIMDLDKYLERINCSNLRDNSLQTLFKLQRNHLINVPFENLDIHLNRYIDCSSLEAIYEKVVVKRRGGFCFELNQLFAWLLVKLGYSVEYLSCSVYNKKYKKWTPWFAHMALMVHINEETSYLCDVGFSLNFRTPLKINPDVIQIDTTGFYKLTTSRALLDDASAMHGERSRTNSSSDAVDENNVYTVVRCTKPNINENDEWQPLYRFNRIPKKIEDFREMIDYVQTKEFPRFFYSSITTIHTTYSTIILVGYDLSETIFFDSIEKTRTNSKLNKTEVFEALKNIYGIQLDAEFEPKNDS